VIVLPVLFVVAPLKRFGNLTQVLVAMTEIARKLSAIM
jgi:hypothetical protein